MHKKYKLLLLFFLAECLLIVISSYISSSYYNLFFIIYLIIFPACFYFISKREISTFVLISLFYFIFKISPFVYNITETIFLPIFEWKKVISIIYLIYLFTRIFFAIKFLRKENNKTEDELSNISLFLINYFRVEKIAKLLTFEIGAIYYCFFKWKKTNSKHKEFTCYKTNGTSYQLYFVIFVISLVEAFVFQVFLHKKYPILAMVFLFLHIYFFITIIGHLKATFFRRNILLKDKFIIRYGLFETCEIPFKNIETINNDNGTYDKRDGNTIKYGLLGQLESHNTLIVLKNPTKFYLPFGKSKTAKRILFFVDKNQNLIDAIKSEILDVNSEIHYQQSVHLKVNNIIQ